MTGFLASVRNLEQARIALAAGADLIDLKAPDRGSLGALSCEEVASIVRELRGARPISATVGDLPMEPARVARAVAEMAQTGVDFVKLGITCNGDALATLRTLAQSGDRGARLIAVFFADEPTLPVPVDRLRSLGFEGCMLDTFDKSRGSLVRYLAVDDLRRFVSNVSRRGLLCGLAGSLDADDIPLLAPLGADYLGFRGALCHRSIRTGELDPARVANIAARMRKNSTGTATSAAPAATGEVV